MTTPAVSFEFFPPKSLEASFRLWDTVQSLAPLDPRFVSVTYGAGGTTRELTRDAVGTLHRSAGLRVAAHLTCVDASREETLGIARDFATAGVKDIVALRGDPPKGTGAFRPHDQGFADSCELISALADTGDFNIRVGAYPERHPEARLRPPALGPALLDPLLHPRAAAQGAGSGIDTSVLHVRRQAPHRPLALRRRGAQAPVRFGHHFVGDGPWW